MIQSQAETTAINTNASTNKFVVPDQGGKFRVRKIAVIRELLKGQRRREKIEKLAAGDDDSQGVIPVDEGTIRCEAESIRRYRADSYVNRSEE